MGDVLGGVDRIVLGGGLRVDASSSVLWNAHDATQSADWGGGETLDRRVRPVDGADARPVDVVAICVCVAEWT